MWRGRTHSLEIFFREECGPPCISRLTDALSPWGASCAWVDVGRMRTCTIDVDTVRFTLEDYPARPELTRLVVACRPLLEAAMGRPSRLGEVGERRAPDPNPACRALSPAPSAGD
jgi:hypothetical protein